MFVCAPIKSADGSATAGAVPCAERVPGLSFGGLLLTVDHGQLSKNQITGETRENTVTPVSSHPEKNVIRVQLKQNEVLRELSDADRNTATLLYQMPVGRVTASSGDAQTDAGRMQRREKGGRSANPE